MIIYSCTSTLYHPPIMTVMMIVINVLVFGITASSDPHSVADYCLWYGSGYHPVQWVTSGFMHADFGHLLGNMLFLWPFGLLVEGKLGWWKFLVLYLIIAIGQNIIEQTIMLGSPATVPVSEVMDAFASDPELMEMSDADRLLFESLLEEQFGGEIRRSLGASAVIFGLLAVCILWAPVSDFMIWWRFGIFEVPVLLVGAFYFGLEFYQWHVSGMGISSAALHLLGLVTGGVVGVIYLRLGIPECDNEDLFNHLFSKSLAKAKTGKIKRRAKQQKSSNSMNSPGLERAQLAASERRKAKQIASKTMPADLSFDTAPFESDFEKISHLQFSRDAKLIVALIDQDEVAGAVQKLRAENRIDVLAMIPPEKYQSLYHRAAGIKQWAATSIILRRWLSGHPEAPESRRLQLARILLLAMRAVDQAQTVLGQISRQNLNEKQTQLYQQLVSKLHKDKLAATERTTPGKSMGDTK